MSRPRLLREPEERNERIGGIKVDEEEGAALLEVVVAAAVPSLRSGR